MTYLSKASPNISPQTAANAPAADMIRPDGTTKGEGYFGRLSRPDGKVSTELSIGVELDGKEMEIPTLVPSLTKKEIDHLINGGDPTDGIASKAISHARQRLRAGKQVWAGVNEKWKLPNE